MPSKLDNSRRWWQVSIRELLVVTLAVAVGLGWWMEREQLRRTVEVQNVELKQAATAQLMWEVKYKNLRVAIEQVLQLEHFGRPLDTYSPEELAELKKAVDKSFAKVSHDEPTAAQIQQRLEFFRKLSALKEGEPIDPPARIGGAPGSGRAEETSP